jgi:macrolide transport system ATP-binding/permease protein
MESIWRDARFAARLLRSSPGFCCAAVVPLALAIGCTGAVLTLVDAVLFRATGIKDPVRVAAVYTFSRSQERYLSNSYADFRDIRSLGDTLDSSAAYLRMTLNVRLDQAAEQMNGEWVTGDYFRATGVVPALGRALTPDDDRPGAPPVALASYTIWENSYGRSPSILGRVAWLDGVAFTIVGVMPKDYRGMLLDWYPDPAFWLPLRQVNRMLPNFRTLDYENRREIQMFMILARLRPGVSVSQFEAGLDVLAARALNADLRFVAFPAPEARFFPAYRDATVRFLWILIAVTAVAVAVACFNLATLLLARMEARQREIAARRALGATPGRLFQQFAVENTILAACSCALSLPIAFAISVWMRGIPVMRGFQISLNLSPDARALGIAVLAACVPCFGLSFLGLLPFGGSRPRVAWRSVFTAAQVACAMAVLVCASLLAQTMRNLDHASLGFDARGLLLASLDLYSANVPRNDADRIVRSILSELREQQPQAAAASDVIPTVMRTTLDVRPDSEPGEGSWKPLAFNRVSDGYFDLLRIPVLSGRAILAADDRSSQPVVVLNESAAARLWPDQNPLGRHLWIRGEPADREVVGVVRDARHRPLVVSETATPCLFLPLLQSGTVGGVNLHVRTRGDPLQFTGALRQIVARVAKDVPVYGVQTMQDHVESGTQQIRAAAEATVAVAALSLILALAGIFAAQAYEVARRKKEIAIRIAVGADPRGVIARFALQGILAGASGTAAGIVPAIWGTELLRTSIQGVGASGEASFVSAAVALVFASGAAACAAALRIAHTRPAEILRAQ